MEQKLREAIAATFVRFYNTYADYLGGGASVLYQNIKVENPEVSLMNCVDLVNRVPEAGDDVRLADVKGVRMDCSLPSFNLVNFKTQFIPQIYLLIDECDAFSNDYLKSNNAILRSAI